MSCLCRLEGRITIRFTHLVRHIFYMDEAPLSIDHKHGPLEETPFLDQCPMSRPNCSLLWEESA